MTSQNQEKSVSKDNTAGTIANLLKDEFIQTVKFYFSPIIALSKDFSFNALKKDFVESPTILGLDPLFKKKDSQNQKSPNP